MSAFLGPIHFWLYNKIGKQEELTKAIASMAAGNGWISDRTAYIRDLPALEDVIDESNIHGWLQDQIHDAETRYFRFAKAGIHSVKAAKRFKMALLLTLES